MNSMRRITTIAGSNPGYHVRFYGKHAVAAWFPVKVLGKRAAEKAAKDWRDQQEKELGLAATDYGGRRPRESFAGKDAGVFVTMGTKRGRFYADVMGVLNYTEDGRNKRKQRAVSIFKHGYHAAYIEALQARCEFTNTPLPEKVVVPKLTEEQIDQLVANGATSKQLTARALVPWLDKLA